MIKIKVVDGIPCIVLDDKKPKPAHHEGYNWPWHDFTFIQRSKEAKSYKAVLDELKDKFKE